jgi:formylglycine-generating enzyme required for sulfatase activity
MSDLQELGNLKSLDWKKLQALTDHFHKAWQAGHSVDLRRFLPPKDSPLRSPTLRELVIIDLEMRWRHGQVVCLEYYLERFPELAASGSSWVQLLAEEYTIRHRHGDKPTLESYHKRFPEHFEEMRRRVEKTEPVRTNASLVRTRKGDPPPVDAVTPPGDDGASEKVLPIGGGFKLLKKIGSGSFGDVWRAEAPGGFPAAVKIIYRPIDHEEAQRELAALEVIRGLRHPYLVQTQAYYSLQDRLYIAMELADSSLRRRLEECRAEGLPGIPPAELLGYFRDAAEGLDYLHREHVLHRDIKPENILLQQGHAKLADFGLARVHGSVRESTATGAGTPLYMAPEIFRGKITLASDQYSLAMTYAELRLGRRLLLGNNLMELMLEHLQQTPDLSPLAEAEQRVILRALHKDPNERYPTCLDWLHDLEAALAPELHPAPAPGQGPLGPGPSTCGTTDVHPVAPPAGRASGRRRFLVVALVAVALGLAGGLVLQVLSRRGSHVNDLASDEHVVPAPQGSFKFELPKDVVLHRGEKKTVPLTIHRTDSFREPIRFTTDRQPGPDAHLTVRQPDEAKGDAETQTVPLIVEADKDARVGIADFIPVTAEGGGHRQEQTLRVTVLFLPAGDTPGTETQTDTDGKSFYKKITWSSPGQHSPVEFVLIPHQKSDDPPSFYMMVDKVSVGLFREFAGSAEYKDRVPPEGKDRVLPARNEKGRGRTMPGWNHDKHPEKYPVFGVTFPEAQLFAKWVGGEVPTTDQWDKATGLTEWDGKDQSAGPFRGTWGGMNPADIAVGKGKPLPVGQAKADVSIYGCRDMAGNGTEWTCTPLFRDDPILTLRGWSFTNSGPLLFKYLKPERGDPVQNFGSSLPEEADTKLGFRVVIEPK